MQASTSGRIAVTDLHRQPVLPRHVRPARCARARDRMAVLRAADDEEAPMVPGDWREFRAKMIMKTGGIPDGARRSEANRRLLEIQSPSLAAEGLWAHATTGPEAGGLLLSTRAAPALLHSERMWQLVIFITSHGPEGTVGLILNKPTGLVLGRKPGGLPLELGGSAPVQQVFQDNQVYCGGYTAQQVLHIMHGYRLPDSVPIVPGVHMAGEAAAAAAVAAGRLPAADFKFFAGALTWQPGQLEDEIAKGAWFTAACSRSLVLKSALQLPVPLWSEVLQLMGGEYAELARDSYEGDE